MNIEKLIQDIENKSTRIRIRFIYNKISEYKNDSTKRIFYRILATRISSVKRMSESEANKKLDIWLMEFIVDVWNQEALDNYINL